jgi:hypothetical protein
MMYFAMCSTMVRTLPCPTGAFGPRNPALGEWLSDLRIR